MKSFAQPKSSRRRESRPVARDLIVGHTLAGRVERGQCRLILAPHRASDHDRRFHDGQELRVRAYVGGPVQCRVTVVTAQASPLAEASTLVNAKLAGDKPVAGFFERNTALYGPDSGHRTVWVVLFALDLSEGPRLLSAAGDSQPGTFALGSDGRWKYVPSEDEHQADHGYTSSTSRALHAEPEALSEADWRTHVQATRDMTHEQWVALSRACEQERLQREHADRGRRRGQARKAA